MEESLPARMRSLVARKFGPPSTYEIMDLPVPEIEEPGQVLIKVHAAAIATGDTLYAAGRMNIFAKIPLPYRFSHEGSGVVVAVGEGVRAFRPGDAVYGLAVRQPMFPIRPVGFASEYAVVHEDLLLPKPARLSWEEAAAAAGSTVTAVQVTRRALALNPSAFPDGTLEGKTAFVTAGLGASTSVAAQVVKNVLGAREVVTSVSTAKVPLLEERMPGVFDRVVDYQTQDVVEAVGRGGVDFLYNSLDDVTSSFPLVEPENGVIASILSIPTSEALKSAFGPGKVPFWLAWIVDALQLWYWWKLRGTNVKMVFLSGNPGVREDLVRAGEIIATAKVRPVVTVVPFDDIEAIRRACEHTWTKKGGVGKLVIRVA